MNTRILKRNDNEFTVLVTSSNPKSESYNYKNYKITIEYGDNSIIAYRIVKYLNLAKKYAAN